MVEQKENNERELSVIIPVHNEENNILSLTDEICKALDDLVNYEIIYVDDGSTDETRAKIIQLTSRLGNIRLVEHDIRGGQSAALYNGVVAAKGSIIATIDGDGQNDNGPAVITFEELHDVETTLYNPAALDLGVRLRIDGPEEDEKYPETFTMSMTDSSGNVESTILTQRDNDRHSYVGRLTADSISNTIWTFSQPLENYQYAEEVSHAEIELEPLGTNMLIAMTYELSLIHI